MTDAVRDLVRLWIERNPDLLPAQNLVVGWEISGIEDDGGMGMRTVEDAEGEAVLFLASRRWYNAGDDDREADFVAAALLHAFERDGTLQVGGGGAVELRFEDRVIRGGYVSRYLEAMVAALVQNRAGFGDDRPAVTFP